MAHYCEACKGIVHASHSDRDGRGQPGRHQAVLWPDRIDARGFGLGKYALRAITRPAQEADDGIIPHVVAVGLRASLQCVDRTRIGGRHLPLWKLQVTTMQGEVVAVKDLAQHELFQVFGGRLGPLVVKAANRSATGELVGVLRSLAVQAIEEDDLLPLPGIQVEPEGDFEGGAFAEPDEAAGTSAEEYSLAPVAS